MIRTISLLWLLGGGANAFNAAYDAGQDAFNRGKYEEARAQFLRAREIAPEKPGPYRWLGRIARVREQWHDCLGNAMQALRLNPGGKQAPEVRKDVEACRAGLGRPPYEGKLHPGQGALAVVANVEGALVTVDGISKGRTPLDPVPLVVGKHTVKVEAAGTVEERPIVIVDGVVADIEISVGRVN